MGLSQGSYDRVALRRPDEFVQNALRTLTRQYPRWGFWKLHHQLRNNDLLINHKRTWRIYRTLELNLSQQLKECLPARVKQPLLMSATTNVCWSLDFTSDVSTDGRWFRTLNVLNDHNRQLLSVEVNFSLPNARVVQVLTRLVERYELPAQLRINNEPKFSSTRLTAWCKAQKIILQ